MQDCPDRGLTTVQVEEIRRLHGDNYLTQKKRVGFFQQFLSNFGDPIIKVLLAALVINLLFLFKSHEWFESIGIAAAVLLATLVSTLSEYGSETAFAKLQEEAEKVMCRIKRDGVIVSLPIGELVNGDIVFLQSGDCVPADGTLLYGKVSVDQSALNGESTETEKTPSSEQERKDLSSRSQLFRGSVVCSGEGVLLVEATGDKTFYGNLAGEIQDETRESPLKVRLARLASSLSKLGFVAAGCVALSDLFHSFIMKNHYSLPFILDALRDPTTTIGNLLHAAMLAITVVVVAVPEGLPMMITVVLSSNMRRMLKDQVLVRKLVGIETSGSLNILFTDKTGTLTKGKPEVSVFVDGDGNEYGKHDIIRCKPLWELVRLSGYYNSDCQLSGRDVLGGNATDKALMAYIMGRHPLNTSCTVLNKIPFDSDRKWSSVEISGDFFVPKTFSRGHLTLIKGAPECLLKACDRYLDADGNLRPLELSTRWHSLRKELEKNAMRLLAIAVCDGPITEPLEGLTLLGIVGLRDELRSDVRKSVQEVRAAGIQTVMMTGDSRETAMAIARAAGILSPKESHTAVVTSEEIARMTDEQLRGRLTNIRVVARALPSDKSRLIRLAQELGMVTGMTGDGINDAPALKKADVGFAMGSGTDVAKQAGDIVILNDHFSAIAKAILYGRTIFKSIRKFIIFQLTMNLCAVGISVIGPFLGVDMPVTVMQMLWINIIMDTLAGLAFAGEPPLPEYMREPPKKRHEPVLNRYMLNQILCTGCFTIALCALFLSWKTIKTLFRYSVDPIYWMTAFFALFIFCGIFNSFNARTHRLNLLAHLEKNPAFVTIMSLVTVVQVLLIYFGGHLFRTAGLLTHEWLWVLIMAALVIPFDWIRKSVLRLYNHKGSI